MGKFHVDILLDLHRRDVMKSKLHPIDPDIFPESRRIKITLSFVVIERPFVLPLGQKCNNETDTIYDTSHVVLYPVHLQLVSLHDNSTYYNTTVFIEE